MRLVFNFLLSWFSFSQSWSDEILEIKELTKNKQWDVALPKAKNLMAFTEKKYGQKSIHYTVVLNWMGMILQNTNVISNAIYKYNQNLLCEIKLIGF